MPFKPHPTDPNKMVYVNHKYDFDGMSLISATHPQSKLDSSEDDDIQTYIKPWVGLTEEEQSFVYDQVKQIVDSKPFWVRFADAIEAKLRSKNT